MNRRDLLIGFSALGGGIIGYASNTSREPVRLSVNCDLDDGSGSVAQYGRAHYGGFNYGGT